MQKRIQSVFLAIAMLMLVSLSTATFFLFRRSSPTVEPSGDLSIVAYAAETDENASDQTRVAASAAVVLTAILTPVGAEGDVTWSMAWKNPSSSWANGKNVSSYIGLFPHWQGPLNCQVRNTAAFEEPILITAKVTGTEISKTVELNYVHRYASVTPNLVQYEGSLGRGIRLSAIPKDFGKYTYRYAYPDFGSITTRGSASATAKINSITYELIESGYLKAIGCPSAVTFNTYTTTSDTLPNSAEKPFWAYFVNWDELTASERTSYLNSINSSYVGYSTYRSECQVKATIEFELGKDNVVTQTLTVEHKLKITL